SLISYLLNTKAGATKSVFERPNKGVHPTAANARRRVTLERYVASPIQADYEDHTSSIQALFCSFLLFLVGRQLSYPSVWNDIHLGATVRSRSSTTRIQRLATRTCGSVAGRFYGRQGSRTFGSTICVIPSLHAPGLIPRCRSSRSRTFSVTRTCARQRAMLTRPRMTSVESVKCRKRSDRKCPVTKRSQKQNRQAKCSPVTCCI